MQAFDELSFIISEIIENLSVTFPSDISSDWLQLQITKPELFLDFGFCHHQPPPTTTNHHQPSSTTTNHQQPPTTTTNHHQPPPTTTNHHHQPPSTTTNHHHNVLIANILCKVVC